jgi:capsular exopolysaccharide synthesis family protein
MMSEFAKKAPPPETLTLAASPTGTGTRPPFGATAVGLGVATAGAVSRALEEQLRRRASGERPYRIGKLMRDMDLLTEEELALVVRELDRLPRLLSDDGFQLAARVRALHHGDSNVLVFSGLAAGDGASTAASQVAVALAMMGPDPVLLVDANLRAPRLHSLFSVTRAPGLVEMIHGERTLEETAHPTVVAGLWVVPTGNLAVDCLPLLASSAFSTTVGWLRERFRYVLIDAAPIARYPEAAIVAAHSDGVLLAILAGHRTDDDLREAQNVLEGLSVPLSGVILTQRDRPGRRSARRGGVESP